MKAIRVRAGSSQVRVFQSRSGKYTRFELRWTDHHGRRRRLKRSTRAAALAEAHRIVGDLARGHHHSEITLADLASFRAGIVNLYGTGKTIELATAEFADAHRLLRAQLAPGERPPTLQDLARHWLDTRATHNTLTQPIAQIVETFLLHLKTRGMSLRHQEDLRARLRRYARDNSMPLAQHSAATVQTWTLGLALAPRTRNNYLAAVQILFADAALAHHPAAPAIRLIKPSLLTPIAKAFWTPKEMRKLLTTAARFDSLLLPALVLGAFGKLRASEAIAMHTSALRLDDAQAILHSGKTGGRLIPLPANCVAWLRAYAPEDGSLWPQSVDAYNAHCRRLAARCNLKWRPNALRKSGQLYDTLLDADYDRVSREAGNSPKMMRRHYVDPTLSTKADAEEWFSIQPPKTKRVIIPIAHPA